MFLGSGVPGRYRGYRFHRNEYPSFGKCLHRQKITVGAAWYEYIVGPLFAALLLLMGICPLAAWGHSTYKTLGRAIWKPLAVSLVILVPAFVLGARQPLSLLAFWLVGTPVR